MLQKSFSPLVILGLPTAISVGLKWCMLLVNLCINPKLIFMTLSHPINPIDLWVKPAWLVSKKTKAEGLLAAQKPTS